MKFYDREIELAQLENLFELSRKKSTMVVMTGRRRIGKTRLLLEFVKDKTSLYFFISRKDEKLLCEEFIEEIQNILKIKVYGRIDNFASLFELLLAESRKRHIILIIDEFQEFLKINPSVYGEMQKIWDMMKNESHMLLILCGSVYSLMSKIFEQSKEPLFGRADRKILLNPFNVEVLEIIYSEKNKQFDQKEFLFFYTLTGGVPRYVEYFFDRNLFSIDLILDEIFQDNSIFLEEGKSVLIEEFGKEYATYFSILSLISSSKTSRSEIESILGKNVGGYLEKLENDFGIIQKIKPVFAKPHSKRQKYHIIDHFLNFWFHFIYKYYSAVEIRNYSYLKNIVKRDLSSYMGRYLEKYFKEKLVLSEHYNIIGSYWEKGHQNEIDIIALNEMKKIALIAEVKLNKSRAYMQNLIQKSSTIVKQLNNYKIEYKIFGLDDVGKSAEELVKSTI